jgi:hypothetical protein
MTAFRLSLNKAKTVKPVYKENRNTENDGRKTNNQELKTDKRCSMTAFRLSVNKA